jgi:hypothetical protein
MTKHDALVEFVLDSFHQAQLIPQEETPEIRHEVYCDIYRAHGLGISLFNMPLEWGKIQLH